MAKEPSTIGNDEGESGTVEFEVFTEAPAVKITNGPEARSDQSEPSFEGTTTPAETEQITVHVYDGSGTAGKQAVALTATPSDGNWSVAASSRCPTAIHGPGDPAELDRQRRRRKRDGRIRNRHRGPDGEPAAARVALEGQQAAVRRVGERSGSDDRPRPRRLDAHGQRNHVLQSHRHESRGMFGDALHGTGGRDLHGGRRRAERHLGNEPGESEPRTFTIYTKAPAVVFTRCRTRGRNRPSPPRRDHDGPGKPESGHGPHLRRFRDLGQGIVGLTANPSGGSGRWPPRRRCRPGPTRARATQASSIGNGEGKSETVEFEIDRSTGGENHERPQEARSKRQTDLRRGSERTEAVTVHVYEGSGHKRDRSGCAAGIGGMTNGTSRIRPVSPTGSTRRWRSSPKLAWATATAKARGRIRSLHEVPGCHVHEGAGDEVQADRAGLRRDDHASRNRSGHSARLRRVGGRAERLPRN